MTISAELLKLIYVVVLLHAHVMCFFSAQESESVGKIVFLHDLSINGTFLNGTKIGMCNS